MEGATDELTALDHAIGTLERQRAALGDAVVDVALAPLVEKRNRLRAADAGEHRRLVTVLFADLVDFTGVATTLDAEDVKAVMARCFAAWRSAIETEGGVVEKFIGDAVMAVFGLHRAREDDPHRAVRAALTMRDALAELSAATRAQHGVAVHMRVGVDTGEVVVTALDDRPGEGAVVVGQVVNRAARLQAAAPQDGILLSPDTCRHVRGAFGLERVPRLRLKGFADEVDGYLVVSGTVPGFWPETRGIEGVTTRTVGRDDELAAMQAHFDAVADDHQARLVTVVGEAGVGKSRLVHDLESWLAARPDEVWVLRGRASPSTEDVPNALLRSVFAERLEVSDTDEPATVCVKWRRGLSGLLEEGPAAVRAADTLATWLGFGLGDAADVAALTADPQGLRRRATSVLTTVLTALTAHAPVVVLLEDLHWADEASLDWLEQLAAAPPALPLLVVATTRPSLAERRPEYAAGAVPELRLRPLTQPQTRALLDDILQRADAVPDGLARRVVDAADGNPFYLEELVKWLVEQGAIEVGDHWRVYADAVDDLRVPTTLRGVLQSRLDALGRNDRGVVERASVVGRVFWDAAVAELAGDASPPADAFERLQAREVVFERGRSAFAGTHEFSFRHALMRDVAYEGVLRSTRRGYHRRAAAWLERVAGRSGRPDEYAAAIAHHHEEAAAAAEGAAWYLRAGRHAAGRYAGDDALRLLGRAERLVPTADAALRADVLLAVEGVLDRLGRRPEQRQVLDRLAALAGLDAAHRAQALLAEGRWLFFHAEYAACLPVADEATARAEEAGRADLALQALVLAGRSLAFAGQHAEARERLTQAVEQARAQGDHRQVAESLRLLGVVATNLAEYERALDLLADAREEHRRIHDVEGEGLVLGQLGAVLTAIGRLDDARVATEDALDRFVESGHRLRQGIVLGNLCTIAIEQGRLDDALRHAVDVLALTREVDDPEGIVTSLVRLGDIHRLLGELGLAREELAGAAELADRHGFGYFAAEAYVPMAAIDLEEGRPDAAQRHADLALTAAKSVEHRHAAARAAVTAALAAHATGAVADGPSPVELLRSAVNDFAALGVGADRADALGALARVLLDEGDLAGARAAVDTLLELLATGAAPGMMEPGRPLVDAHRVLVATGDPRAADVASRARDLLTARTAVVRAPAIRAAVLARPVARELAEVAADAPPRS